MDNKEIMRRIEAALSDPEAKKDEAIVRPAMSPFDVELDEAHLSSVAKEIEALNKALASGNRGYFDVPTGHANVIKANFENARGKDGRKWIVEITSVNPTFAKIWFRTDGDPLVE